MKEKEFIRKSKGRPITVPRTKLNKPEDDDDFSVEILKNFQKDSGNIENQFIAIKIMEMNSKISSEDAIIPNYKKVGKLLNVKESALRTWWKNRNKIISGVKIVNKDLGEFIQLKLMNLTIDLINSLAKSDFEKETTRDKITLLNTTFNRMKDVMGTNKQKGNKRREIGKLIPSK